MISRDSWGDRFRRDYVRRSLWRGIEDNVMFVISGSVDDSGIFNGKNAGDFGYMDPSPYNNMSSKVRYFCNLSEPIFEAVYEDLKGDLHE